jgi:hypothetical protein
MSKFTYNLEEDSSDQNLPAGRYLAKITEAEESTSNAGHPKLVTMLKIIKGDYKGYYIKHHISLQPHVRDIVMRFLKAVGYSGNVTLDTDDLVGRRACLVVDIEVIKDKRTGEIKEFPKVIAVLPADEYERPKND